MIKKGFSFFILLLFILPFVGYFHHLLELKQVKSENKLALARQNPELIMDVKIPISEFKSDQNEIVIQDEHFDILFSKIEGDSVELMCFKDKKETKIQYKITSFFEDIFSINTHSKDNSKQICKFFKSLFYQEIEMIEQRMFLTSTAKQIFNYRFNPYDISIEVISPPPICLV